MSEPPAKKRRSIEEDVRVFQIYRTEIFGVIEKDNKAFCIFGFETVVCRTFVKRHFEGVLNNMNNKIEKEQRELISSQVRQMNKTLILWTSFQAGPVPIKLLLVLKFQR